MNAFSVIANAARRLDAMFPGYFPEAKHDHYSDFGYPQNLTFSMLHGMYQRNGFARAAVNKTALKTWETHPGLWESEKPTESKLEGEIRQRFADVRVWQRLAETDRRSMVGGYAGAILRLADDRRFQEPVDRVPGGLLGLVEIIPAWAGQLTVAEWDTDEASPDYGSPKMFAFNEAALPGSTVTENSRTRSFTLHPDRVILWSSDGTVHADPLLAPGYNDLVTLEKVSGAGGEGFWKNAKSAPVLEASKDADIDDMARAMGVDRDDIVDAMQEQVGDWQKGFDKLLMIKGMTAKTLGVTLPSPEHFFNIALQGFAASINCPLKILVGNQTGERASTEDARDWAQTNMARRNDYVVPSIMEFVRRLERFGILKEKDWTIGWTDLTESTMAEKIERAEKMARINQMMASDPVFLQEEVRAVMDMDPAEPPEEGEDE